MSMSCCMCELMETAQSLCDDTCRGCTAKVGMRARTAHLVWFLMSVGCEPGPSRSDQNEDVGRSERKTPDSLRKSTGTLKFIDCTHNRQINKTNTNKTIDTKNRTTFAATAASARAVASDTFPLAKEPERERGARRQV